jgi:hypothetical protein
LRLKDVDGTGHPDIQGVETTGEWREDSQAGLVYIQFQCVFGSGYSEAGHNQYNLWGFDDITAYGLPAPSDAVNNVIGGSVSAHPSPLTAAVGPGGHQLLIAGFRGRQIVFAHSSTAQGVTRSYLNRNSPYSWTYVSAVVPATVKGTIFYRRA